MLRPRKGETARQSRIFIGNFGRTYLGDRFINLEMVRDRFARRYVFAAGDQGSSRQAMGKPETGLDQWIHGLGH